ncbi:MAG: PAS domain S-box-containing protein, partial [Pseudohongiellaceae bacterium]
MAPVSPSLCRLLVSSAFEHNMEPNGVYLNTPNITLIVRIFVVVAIVEAAIMLAFSMAPTSVQLLLQQYPRTVIVLDIITLMLISSPIVYFWGIRPFVLAHSKTESLLIDSERRYGFLFAHLPQGVMVEDYSAVKKGVDQLLSEGIKDLETYLKNNPELLYELASKVRVVAANHALLELYGCDSLRELIAGEEDLPLWWNDDWLAFYASEIMSFTRNKKHKFEVSDTREDGSDFKTSVISIVPKGNEETWSKVLTLHEDITVRRQREQMILDNQSVLEKLVKERTAKLEAAFSATEQSEAFLAQCTEIAHLGYAIWDNDLDRDITVSKKLANIHGLTVEEYIDTVSSTERYLDFVVPDDRAKYLSYENMVFADFDDEVESVEYRIMRADGEIRYLHQRSQPIQVTSGQKNKEIVVIQDVTELKQAEINLKESLKALKKSETLRVQAANIANKARGDQERERKESAAQIIQASKLATLGEMATSVAHELNQPLNIIRLA